MTFNYMIHEFFRNYQFSNRTGHDLLSNSSLVFTSDDH